MKDKIIWVGLGALIIGLIGGYWFSQTGRYGHMMGYYGWGDSFLADKNPRNLDRDESGSGHMMGGGMHNGALTEREFIDGMIPHHQEAVDTAKQVLERGGTTAEMKALAQSIITAQEKEIADMKTWYKTWYGADYQTDGKYRPMMRDLSSLSGAELDKAFLEDMIMHHMGALMMAQSVVTNIEHAEIKELTSNIAKTQSDEIIAMRIILKQY